MLKLKENKVLGSLAKMENAEDVSTCLREVEKLKNYVEEELYLQTKTRTKSQKRKEKSFIKLAKDFANDDSVRYSLSGAFIEDDKLNITNGYYGITMNNTDIKCRMVDDNVKTIKLSNIYPNLDGFHLVDVDYNDLKAQYKIYKNNIKGLRGSDRDVTIENKGKYIIENSHFNIKFLYDISKVLDFNDCEFYIKDTLDPMVIKEKSTGNKAIILPFRQD